MTSPHMPPRRAREHKTAPTTPEPRSDVGEDRQASPEPSYKHLRNLAVSHANEADRWAENTPHADLTHALLAHFWLTLAKEERP